jgi:hypothetical protein
MYISVIHTHSRGLGWRIHGSVEDTKLSTNKQHTHTLSLSLSLSLHTHTHTHTPAETPPRRGCVAIIKAEAVSKET